MAKFINIALYTCTHQVRDDLSFIERKKYFLAEYPAGENPGTGEICTYGLVNSLYESWVNFMQNDFNLLGKVGFLGNTAIYSIANFKNFFPLYEYVTAVSLVNGVDNIMVNEDNGYVLSVNQTGGGAVLYASLEDYFSNNYIDRDSSYTTKFMSCNITSLYGATRGQDYLYAIASVNEGGVITGLKELEFRGISSTQNCIYITNVRNVTDAALLAFLGEPEDMSTDPYDEGGNSSGGGGGGSFSGTSDDIEIPALPTISAVDTGFITIYNPSLADLRSLASYMWNPSAFDISDFQKLFADPMESILGLSIIPVSVPNGTRQLVKIGNITTTVYMAPALSQYVEVNCGSISVAEYWGGYLDYAPYTKISIYLPYCGTHELDTDELMGRTVAVKYHVDILSGACTAFVKCGSSVLYTFNGQCGCQVPVNGRDFASVLQGAISVATSALGLVSASTPSPSFPGSIASAGVNIIKPNVNHSGAIGNSGGLMSIQTPYLIITRPRQAHPENQIHYTGYPSFVTVKLKGASGYTEVEKIHLENLPCTELELEEIENYLHSGVILPD